MNRILPLLLSVALASPAAQAADPDKPHPHQGKAKPYTAPFPPVKLTAAERAKLAKNIPVHKIIDVDGGGRGFAIFEVNADPSTTWGVLNSFGNYAKWVKNVDEVTIYKTKGNHILTDFKISSGLIKMQYYIDHDFHQDERWGTWTLDYSRKSDLDDSVGFWRVTPVAGKENRSMVEYSIDVRIGDWVADFIRKILVDQGLKTATSWVKVQAEKRFKAKNSLKPKAKPKTDAKR